MFKRLYFRLLLAALPSVETVLRELATIVQKLDIKTHHMEGAIEEEVVKMANDVKSRRDAIEAVEKTFQNRTDNSVKFIETVKADLHKAAEARTAVAKLLGL
jgi:hypothetical protein